MVWTHDQYKLGQCFKNLNEIHSNIKFTDEFSQTESNFLETTIKIDHDHKFHTTLYEKPTDTHLCLHYKSSHHVPAKQK